MVRLQRVVKLHTWCPRSERPPVPEEHHGNAIPSSVGIATERCFRSISEWSVRRLPEVPQMVRLQRVVKLHTWCPESEHPPVPENDRGNAIPSSVRIITERCFRDDSDWSVRRLPEMPRMSRIQVP